MNRYTDKRTYQRLFKALLINHELDTVCHGMPDILHADPRILYAAETGNITEVRKLIDKQADVNTVGCDKRTALHLSCCENHEHIVQLLINHNANVNAKDRWGRRPSNGANSRNIIGMLENAGDTSAVKMIMQLSVYCPGEVTVLLMDITNFTASCSKLTAHDVGEWVSTFYTIVDQAAGPHGVRKAEVRGDCCICVTGDMHAAPCGRLRSCASADDQVTRMLQFASVLHERFLVAKPRATNVRMGIAVGDAAFLLDEDFISVQGDVVNTAARMESHSFPGMAIVHISAVERWVRETSGHSPPVCNLFDCKGKDPQPAAVYDCVGKTFRVGMPYLYDI